MVVVIGCDGIGVQVGVGSVVRFWRVVRGVVADHVCLLRCCLAALVLNFKIRKDFTTNFTYVRRANSHNCAFTHKCLRENAKISAFKFCHICECHSHSATYL